MWQGIHLHNCSGLQFISGNQPEGKSSQNNACNKLPVTVLKRIFLIKLKLMKTYFIDSFTKEKFRGNPAAVCVTENALNEMLMQNAATEIGFSETAFITGIEKNIFNIRFFTPLKEITLCGHATLASAKILFDTTDLKHVVFINKEGIKLTAERAGAKIKMQFPVYDTVPFEAPSAMLKALGTEQIINACFNKERNIVLLEISSTTALQKLSPDFSALLQSYQGIAGVLVTAKSGEGNFDFHYRYFWPWTGSNEDPVTGAVHTFLTKYWALKLNKKNLKAFQSSRRSGEMKTEWADDKVFIYGEAITVLEGILNI